MGNPLFRFDIVVLKFQSFSMSGGARAKIARILLAG